jgi:octanoyl-[GcvH]:protein N-octanoyltransferase
MKPALQLIRGGCPGEAAFGTAVSNAVLQRVASGELPDTGRLGRPGRILTFGRRDAVCAGYPVALEAARAAGYEVVERIAGGRAAAYNGKAINLSRAKADPNPAAGTRTRFAEMAELVRSALASLGVDARIGEVPGEYCPGAFSVNAGGRVKLAGIGQRLIKGGAHLGCVIVAAGTEELRDVLVPVYAALEIEWDPAKAGSVEDEAKGVTASDVEAALMTELERRFELSESRLDPKTEALATGLLARHRPGEAA